MGELCPELDEDAIVPLIRWPMLASLIVRVAR